MTMTDYVGDSFSHGPSQDHVERRRPFSAQLLDIIGNSRCFEQLSRAISFVDQCWLSVARKTIAGFAQYLTRDLFYLGEFLGIACGFFGDQVPGQFALEGNHRSVA